MVLHLIKLILLNLCPTFLPLSIASCTSDPGMRIWNYFSTQSSLASGDRVLVSPGSSILLPFCTLFKSFSKSDLWKHNFLLALEFDFAVCILGPCSEVDGLPAEPGSQSPEQVSSLPAHFTAGLHSLFRTWHPNPILIGTILEWCACIVPSTIHSCYLANPAKCLCL